MPHEWISTLATLALSVLVLSTVTFTTQQYVFSLEETLAEDQLQDIADEIASTAIEMYRIGRQSSDATASEPLKIIASTRLQPQERTVSGSFYQIVLNNSTGSVEIYLVTDPNTESSTTLQGINEIVDLTGNASSGNNTYISYQKRYDQRDLIIITDTAPSISP